MFRIAILAVTFGLAFWAHESQAYKITQGQFVMDKLSDYELCLTLDNQGLLCLDSMERWVKGHPADSFEAGKIVRKKMASWSALSLLNQGFDIKKGHCKDEDLKLSVISALGQSATDKRELVEMAKKIAFHSCFNEMQEGILKDAEIGSLVFINACQDLVEKGSLKGLKKKKCEEKK